MRKIVVIGLLILGTINVHASWNPFSKEWYEDCKSDIMIKNYTENFELMFDRKYGENSTKAELISEIQEISKKPLKCKVRLHFRINLSTFRYHEGTITTVTRINGFNKKTGKVNQDIFTMDEDARTHNIINDVRREQGY
ncbi:hypothetical protein [Sulfurimonas sp.]